MSFSNFTIDTKKKTRDDKRKEVETMRAAHSPVNLVPLPPYPNPLPPTLCHFSLCSTESFSDGHARRSFPRRGRKNKTIPSFARLRARHLSDRAFNHRPLSPITAQRHQNKTAQKMRQAITEKKTHTKNTSKQEKENKKSKLIISSKIASTASREQKSLRKVLAAPIALSV